MILTNANLGNNFQNIFKIIHLIECRSHLISRYDSYALQVQISGSAEISGRISSYLARKSKTKENKMLLKMLSW